MGGRGRFIGIKGKIIFSMLIPVILTYSLIIAVIFGSLFNSLHKTAQAEFSHIGQKHAAIFENKINRALDYLSIVSKFLDFQVEKNYTDRKELQKTVLDIFDKYEVVDGSSIYFEPNMYDGKDAEYVNTMYGSSKSGRISYYFYKSDGQTKYLSQAMEDDIEFEMPHYTEAKRLNKPVYTEPITYEIDGKKIPMLTITYPIKNINNEFIGATTVDLFLEDIYNLLKSEKIYETGHIVIANDAHKVVYSPRNEDIGKTWEEIGFNYTLPIVGEKAVYSDITSVINGQKSLVTINSIYIPQFERHFYICTTAPLKEVNANGTRLMIIIISCIVLITILISCLLYYLTGKITEPLQEITSTANEMAGGNYSTRILGDYEDEFGIVKDSVNKMADNIEAYVNEVKKSQSILRNIMNGMDAYIYVTSPETNEILFVNEKMKEDFKVGGDPTGKICYKVLQESMDKRCDFCPCYQLDKNPSQIIVWEMRNTLTKRDYRNTDCYIDWIDGRKVHLQYSVDITTMKKYMNDKLLAEREALELKHEKEIAEKSARAKNDFLAKMSHEIRTPMNAVMGMSELILRKDLPQDVYEHAMVIKSASVNLLSIINDILDFSKIESGMLEIIETEYMLSSLINDVINIVRVRLVDRDIDFAVKISSKIPANLVGDEIRIRQILLNLLSNAVKYTDEGVILLEIDCKITADTAILTISVTDSGIGIKQEDMGKLFGDFVQIDTTKNKGVEGTGLGLAICRGLIIAMGGTIKVESQYGEGSVFTVTLPQKFTAEQAFAKVDNPEEKAVLLYETREIHRDSILWTLDDLGVECKVAANIADLFANLPKYRFVFVSSFVRDSVYPILMDMDNPPKLILLSDLAETQVAKNTKTLLLPVQPLAVSNILNDIQTEFAVYAGASFTAPDAKILIVDDILTNLKVAEGLLLPYEMQVDICISGKEALNLIAKNEYDLVFMDHMMPEMDGLETTARIRQMQGQYFKNLPIIALTANAVSGIREMFIQNGMNDFLAKPIETVKLDAILNTWIAQDKHKKIIVSETLQQISAFAEMLKTVPELSVEKAVSVIGGSMEFYERILKLSIKLLPENIERLNNLINTNLADYAIQIHGIKGVLNNIGAYNLGKIAEDLEMLSKNGQLDSCLKIHPDFINKLVKFSNRIEALLKETANFDKVSGDNKLLLDVLPQLIEAAEFFDRESALEILTPICTHTFGEVLDKLIIDINGAFEIFDFDKAEELLDDLREELNNIG